MITIGIDLDNTLICYEKAYGKIADELGIDVCQKTSARKAVKDYCLSKAKGNLEWTLIQGKVYGELIEDAELFEGSLEAIQRLLKLGYLVKIISHKTIFSAVGEVFDFWTAAESFIKEKIINLLPKENLERFSYQFCQTLDEKLLEISSSKCSVFIDDLQSVLNHSLFPKDTFGIWFSEQNGNNWKKILGEIDFSRISSTPNQTQQSRKRLDANTCLVKLMKELQEFPTDFIPLEGGINNAVFKIVCESGNIYCGKYYKRDPHDSRDRMNHEISFLEYCDFSGIDCVPKVLASDHANGACLLSFIEGKRWAEDTIVDEEVWAQFVTFFKRLQLNKDTEEAKKLPRAAEGARSLQEHLGWVHRRRDSWRKKALSDQLDQKHRNYILIDLEEAYQNIAVECIASDDFKSTFPNKNSVISPSDFGLHNALVNENGEVSFVDFEYAGWDDQNKAIADFELQPRFDSINRKGVIGITSTQLIGDLLKLKWSYIVLAANHGKLAGK